MGDWDLVETTVKVRAEYRSIDGCGQAKTRMLRDRSDLRKQFGPGVQVESWVPVGDGGVVDFEFAIPGRLHETGLSQALSDILRSSPVWRVKWVAQVRETVVSRAGEW